MTVFALKEESGAWFDMEGGGRVQLRTISPSDWRKIRKATVRKEAMFPLINGTHQLYEREIVDEDLQIEMINDFSIVGWENLFDEDNSPIPCTKENKLKLMFHKSGVFRDFVNAKMEVLRKAEEGQAEQTEKN